MNVSTAGFLFRVLALCAIVLTSRDIQAQTGQAATNYSLTVTAERDGAIYGQGDSVVFVIQLARGQQPVEEATVDWTISKDGVPPVSQGKLAVIDGRGVVASTLTEPGFLLCRATFQTPGGSSISALGGAGVDPLQIKPSLPVPDDFDAFWQEQKRKLAEVPVNPRLTLVRAPRDGIESFDLQADCLGAPVSGYFSRPAKAKAASSPAILTVHGAGVRSSDLNTTASYATEGFLALDINAHGLPNGKPVAFYADMAKGDLSDYRGRVGESRETVYFLGMFLRLVRAIDFLTAQPEWDGRTLVVRGSSQGGAQAIVAAGLDSRVTFFAALVPAMCDHTGTVVGRVCGWPKIVPAGPDGNPDPRILEIARYYDAVNFAARAKAPGYFTVGFIDTTCPPSSVYSAYNALKAPKDIFNDPPSRHENTPRSLVAVREAIQRHLREQKGKQP